MDGAALVVTLYFDSNSRAVVRPVLTAINHFNVIALTDICQRGK
jgi:hypothetical protein